MDFSLNHQIDGTLIKMVLNSVQDGDLSVIKQNAEKYNLDMNFINRKRKPAKCIFLLCLSKK